MLIVGTAGHIDHGKTTLIRALTGIDTDRLREEKERGISIELGFAWIDLPGGRRCGIIDVPGHERFVRQMIAGAAGIDVVLLVIAADEGVMPQTREHLDICRLLGVRRGAVVLTKTDLVEEDWLELVEEEVREFTAGTFLEGAPVFRFSAVDDAVAQAFRHELEDWLDTVEAESGPSGDIDAPFVLPIDRIFTIHGFGTVVTGTVLAGQIGTGDEVEVLPGGPRGRVRGIQVHERPVKSVGVGSRAALNILGVDRTTARRGQVVALAGALRPTSMFDASIELLEGTGRAFERRFKALVHAGTDQILATVAVLDAEMASEGDRVLAQVRLERPTVVRPGARFVLRGFEVLANYGKTFGGGIVLDPHPVKHRAGRPEVIEHLRALRDGDAPARLSALLAAAGPAGLARSELVRRARVPVGQLSSHLRAIEQRGDAYRFDVDEPTWVHREVWEQVQARCVEQVDAYHERYPSRPGISREELRGRAGRGVHPRLFALALDGLVQSGQLALHGDLVARPGYAPRVEGALLDAVERLTAICDAAGLQPPLLADIREELGVPEPLFREALEVAQRQGRVVRVTERLWFSAAALDELERRLVAFLEEHGEITTTQFKELTGTTRKYAIPLGEYFDARRVTVRVGDNVRRLRRA